MGIFSFLRRKKKEEVVNTFRIKKIAELSTSEKEILRQEYKSFLEKFEERNKTQREEIKEKVRISNSVCPKCNSTNVSDRSRRIKGDINGSSSSFGSSGMFGGSSFCSSSIHGKIDTESVNKCNDCKNEWNKVESWSPYTSSLSDVADILCKALDYIHHCYYKVTLDENNLSEEFSSVVEKRNYLISKIPDYFWVKEAMDIFSDNSIELAQYIIDENVYSSFYEDEWNNSDKSLLIKVLKMKSICQS